MELKTNVQLKILKPVEEVFEAVVNNEKMSGYFISSGTGRLEAGKIVTWEFADYNAVLDIKVESVSKNEIIFLWSASGVETKVIFYFLKDGDNTILKITEDGWNKDDEGIERALEQTKGWAQMSVCLKGYVEFGVALRG